MNYAILDRYPHLAELSQPLLAACPWPCSTSGTQSTLLSEHGTCCPDFWLCRCQSCLKIQLPCMLQFMMFIAPSG